MKTSANNFTVVTCFREVLECASPLALLIPSLLGGSGEISPNVFAH